jgi:ABC-type Fe3+ transport system permease subunit
LVRLTRLSKRDIFRQILGPQLHTKILRTFALLTCFALGEVSVPLLLGQQEINTFSVLSYKAFLTYDIEKAMGYMGILVVIMAGCFILSQKWMGEKRKEANDAFKGREPNLYLSQD